jgi:hypothetical protein
VYSARVPLQRYTIESARRSPDRIAIEEEDGAATSVGVRDARSDRVRDRFAISILSLSVT